MQFQAQKMVKKEDKGLENIQRESDAMDLYVGLKTGLDDPFNIFLRVSDISSDKELIYFYAYSFGKKKVVLWGVYNRNSNEFLIDNACRYSPNDLKYMLDTWKAHDYNFYFSSVRNRITTRMDQELLFDNRKYEMEIFNTFKDYFLVKLARTGSISPNILNTVNKKLYSSENFEIEYQKILNKIVSEIGTVLDSEYVNVNEYVFEVLFEEIENKEEENVIRKALSKKIDITRLDSYLANLVKYLLVNIFICVFADMNEYRTAKYILYLNDSKEGDKIRSMLKGNFFYEWIIELARVLKISNVKSFVNQYAKATVNLIEKKINFSDIGVIGAPRAAKGKTVLIENISIFFEDFISKSKYSKISYTNDLSICPDPKSCIDGSCEVYDHGFKTTSQYDLT